MSKNYKLQKGIVWKYKKQEINNKKIYISH